MIERPEQDSDNPFTASANPYQASTQYELQKVQRSERTFWQGLPWIFTKWFLICYVCATPSFFLGLAFTNGTFPSILGMVVGVFCYVIGYTLLEGTSFVQRILQDRVVRRAVKIGYTIRIVFSVAPLLTPLDLFLGIASTTAGSYITMAVYPLQDDMSPFFTEEFGPALMFSFTSTIIQGALMNVVLLGFVAIVYGICSLVMDPMKGSTNGTR
jgi:hypothetical protein